MYLSLMRAVSLSAGVLLSLYSDRHTIFHSPREPTVIEQLANQRPLTQFGRAMEELGVSLVKAYSPQAKGRIEWQWGVFRDRPVVESRLAGARTLADANQVLADFLPGYNRSFTVPPRQQAAVWRKSPPAHQLDRVLCLKEARVVGRDHVVSFDGLALQLTSARKYFSLERQRVRGAATQRRERRGASRAADGDALHGDCHRAAYPARGNGEETVLEVPASRAAKVMGINRHSAERVCQIVRRRLARECDLHSPLGRRGRSRRVLLRRLAQRALRGRLRRARLRPGLRRRPD